MSGIKDGRPDCLACTYSVYHDERITYVRSL